MVGNATRHVGHGWGDGHGGDNGGSGTTTGTVIQPVARSVMRPGYEVGNATRCTVDGAISMQFITRSVKRLVYNPLAVDGANTNVVAVQGCEEG